VELKLIGEIAAGGGADQAVANGQAIAIMTGAPMALGADCVVPVEDTQRLSDGAVRIMRSFSSGKFIARRGSDCASNAIVLHRHTKLSSPQIAVAASIGATEVEAFDPPRVAVMTTGNELVPMHESPRDSQIRESNCPMLRALLRRLGCHVNDCEIVRDDYETIRDRIEVAMRDHEIVFVSGGMSMGQYDFVPRAIESLGIDLRITKLRIKPGKPFVFGVKSNDRFIFGLPGNPVSAFVCALRLASRLIERMSGGGSEDAEHWVSAPVAKPLAANGPREFYQPAVYDGHTGTITPLEWKGSADIFTLADANVLLVRGENEPPIAAGTVVRALEIPQ
jgi:molybdopterin molybdotransferase